MPSEQAPSIDQRIQTVETMFGFKMHDYQDQALRAIADGKNVILHVPTGGGN